MKQKIYNKNHEVVLTKQYSNPTSCITSMEGQQSSGFIDIKSNRNKDRIINPRLKIQTKIYIKPTIKFSIKQRYQTKSDEGQQNSQIYVNNQQNKSEYEKKYNKIKNISNERKLDLLSLRSKKQFKISRQTNNNFYSPIEDVSLNKIDPKRVSRYNKSMSTELKQKQKFDKSLERYMLARTKMSQLLDKDKKNTGEFQQIQLNKSNRMLQNRKLHQLKSLNSQQKYKNFKTNQFVSYLIPKFRNDIPTAKTKYNDFCILQNQMIKSVKVKNNNVKRCDALLVNFVGTYFRKKFYKKSKKIYSNRRTKTDDIEMVKMIGLEGNQINDEIISESFSFNPINFEQIQQQNIKKIKIKI